MTALAAMVPVTVAFGRRVRELRQERGWTLRYAGALADLDYSTLCKVEQGKGTTLSRAERIALAFGVPLVTLIAPDSCGHCHGAPPRGFTCGTCGEAGPGVAS